MRPWTWVDGTPRERANMVRAHHRPALMVPFDQLCELFNLTTNGLHKILDGDDWRPQYQRRKARRKPMPVAEVSKSPRTYLRPDGTEMVEIMPDCFVSRAATERIRRANEDDAG